MHKLIIPIGIPGCGKTTWCKQMFPRSYYVGTDEIREALHPGIDYIAERNRDVFETFHETLHGSMRAFDAADVVADATNLAADARIAIFRHVPSGGRIQVHYVVFKNVVQAIMRNTQRGANGGRRVPEEAMLEMIRKYEVMLREVPHERFDAITYISELG